MTTNKSRPRRPGRRGPLSTAWFGFILLVVFLAVCAPGITGAGPSISYMQTVGFCFALLIAAVGLNILTGNAGLVSVGQGAFFAAGAYAAAWGLEETKLVWPVAVALGLLVAALLGVAIAYASLRLKGPLVAIVTLVFAIVLARLITDVETFGRLSGYPNVLQNGKMLVDNPSIGGFEIARPYLPGVAPLAVVVLAVVAVLVLMFARNLVNSSWGRSLESVRLGETLASHLGVPVLRTKVTAFVLAAALGALGGTGYLLIYGRLQPESFGFDLGIDLLLVVLVGGIRTTIGPVLGVAFLAALEFSPLANAFVEFQRDTFDAVWLGATGIAGLVLILVLRFLPGGIVGTIMHAVSERQGRVADGAADRSSEAGAPSPPLRVSEEGRAVLSVEGVELSFGGVKAVDGVELRVERGSIHALVGPNGAGKTTLLNIVSGIYRPSLGSVYAGGKDVSGLRPDRIRAFGVARTFQVPTLFDDQTVRENVVRGMAVLYRHSLFAVAFNSPKVRRNERQAHESADRILEFLGLENDAHLRAGELPYGRRRTLEIGMALAGEPMLLLLDEPAAGLNQTEGAELADALVRLRDAGLAMLLVEHHMDLVAKVASEVTCMDQGKVIFQGTPSDFTRDLAVREAYLGKQAAAGTERTGV
ncbi:branched-chain amino acid ABC transporter ATP-binding protein/permease [Arthrobacter sp. ISL-28]|uniref:branched-chain amino acid ABC transporter ATP-binding protein/permease n=1 Tax=Arthrobacter sp. ISL-28 TaxID=2819108 RepID=UPI001BEA96CC|nr:branched-chain amino acid ABC transporter ATP-binding protein/permease [Arthrobacter sp. ISL-28]MBT2523313.1 branched-chain amino acid ABC transporter ATP-binding protein/permease [Arthrobacter sp. ISL-28]